MLTRGIPVIRQNNFGFNPSQIKDSEGNLLLSQQLFTKHLADIDGTIFDESKNTGDARPVELGRCYNFDGVDDYVVIPHNPQLNVSDKFSVFVKAENNKSNLTVNNILVAKYESTNNQREWHLSIGTQQQLLLTLADPVTGQYLGFWRSNSPITILNKNTYGATYDNGVISLFVNGVEVPSQLGNGTIPTSIFNGDADMTIGCIGSISPSFFWDGKISDVQVYTDVALTNQEMLSIHNNKKISPQPIALYKCDEQTGVIAYDSSGNGHNGTIMNANLSTFHSTQDVYSWQNEVGYTKRMYFDGINDKVLLTNGFNIGTQDFAIEARVGESLQAGRIIQQGINVAQGGFFFGITTLDGGGFAAGIDSIFNTLPFDIKKGALYKAVFERLNDRCVIYENGTYVGEISIPEKSNFNITANNSVTIGGRVNDNLVIFRGVLSDIKIDIGNNGVWDSVYTGYLNTNESWKDQVGSNDGTLLGSPENTYLPRNEAIPSEDVLGQNLEFKGKVPYNARAKQSNGLSLNGIDQHIEITGMGSSVNYFGACTISATVNITSPETSSSVWALGASVYRMLIFGSTWRLNVGTDTEIPVTTGTHRLSVTYNSEGEATSFSLNNEVVWTGIAPAGTSPTNVFYIGTRDFNGLGLYFEGEIYDFSITGSPVKNFHFHMAEGTGDIVYDKSGEKNHGLLINAPTWIKQDTHHHNLLEGFNKYMYFDGVDDGVSFSTPLIPETGDFEITYKTQLPVGYLPSQNEYVISQYSSPSGTGRFILGITTSSQLFFAVGATNANSGAYLINDGIKHNIRLTRVGNTFTLFSDNVQRIQFNTSSVVENVNTEIGKTSSISRFYKGLIWDVNINNEHAYKGYDASNAGWLDKIGNQNGTVFGSPNNVFIPALNSTQDVFEEPLRNKAGAYHNGAETLIDFTGGVASPEAVINNWETDWAFNDARVNPKFNRTLTDDGDEAWADRFLAYKETLSEPNLTKVNKYVETKEI